MTRKMSPIILHNDHDSAPFHDLHAIVVHPLAASTASQSACTAQIPAWIDTIPNRVAMKSAFLEIIKPD